MLKTRVLFWLANVLVSFIGCLVSDKLYSKLKRLLGLQMVGLKVIAFIVFKTRLGLEEEDSSFNVVGEVVCGSAVYASGRVRLKVEGDRSS